METAYQKVKVHNEVEWCEVADPELKAEIEKSLLKNGVSYFITWVKPKLFSGDKREKCIFCVNALQKERADEAIKPLCENQENDIRFLNKKVERSYY
ncbi:MAG: hypothetical protein K6E33_08850 [Lachnospiraceae bacterium]|nr:hypothetical protein [Lachnospiraceae bacterium]